MTTTVLRLNPFPNPKNNAEREANRKASDEYQHQVEASDLLDWEKQLDWQ
ncbi:hypothetical protein [Streptomyces cavernae]|nr:hypothetical protein [Streptomyces cavernae]